VLVIHVDDERLRKDWAAMRFEALKDAEGEKAEVERDRFEDD